ncbi:uncharacterized protein BDV14DRAFT_75999 [Aspergillus stella-maris]|uniref:uncharacterized protein n=1 Tax=Aspergillus stella-maris TaxID=1810926 RepID=UPI003CCD547C
MTLSADSAGVLQHIANKPFVLLHQLCCSDPTLPLFTSPCILRSLQAKHLKPHVLRFLSRMHGGQRTCDHHPSFASLLNPASKGQHHHGAAANKCPGVLSVLLNILDALGILLAASTPGESHYFLSRTILQTLDGPSGAVSEKQYHEGPRTPLFHDSCSKSMS